MKPFLNTNTSSLTQTQLLQLYTYTHTHTHINLRMQKFIYKTKAACVSVSSYRVRIISHFKIVLRSSSLHIQSYDPAAQKYQ